MPALLFIAFAVYIVIAFLIGILLAYPIPTAITFTVIAAGALIHDIYNKSIL